MSASADNGLPSRAEQQPSATQIDHVRRAHAALDSGDFAGAAALLDPLCTAGLAEALFLRSRFAMPDESQVDFEARHVAQLERAASLGNAEAQYALSMLLASGELLPRDQERAGTLLRAAAKGRHPHAMWQLGLMLVYGTGGESADESVGLSLIQEAAALRSEGALRTLGDFYRAGLFGLERNVDEAQRLAAIADSPDALPL